MEDQMIHWMRGHVGETKAITAAVLLIYGWLRLRHLQRKRDRKAARDFETSILKRVSYQGGTK
jgi:hypothetical protein